VLRLLLQLKQTLFLHLLLVQIVVELPNVLVLAFRAFRKDVVRVRQNVLADALLAEGQLLLSPGLLLVFSSRINCDSMYVLTSPSIVANSAIEQSELAR
jgi:hypothetical protein